MEREELFAQIREEHGSIKLRSLMIESFMPEHFFREVVQARRWDPVNEVWVLPRLDLAGNTVNQPELTDGGQEHEELLAHYERAGAVPDPDEIYLRVGPHDGAGAAAGVGRR